MRHQTPRLLTGLTLAAVQVLDIILHVATLQAEPLRIAANLAILFWLGVMAAGRFSANAVVMALTALGVYLGLNLVFLVREGLTNAAQGGAPRMALFVLVAVTTALSAVLIYVRGKADSPSSPPRESA